MCYGLGPALYLENSLANVRVLDGVMLIDNIVDVDVFDAGGMLVGEALRSDWADEDKDYPGGLNRVELTDRFMCLTRKVVRDSLVLGRVRMQFHLETVSNVVAQVRGRLRSYVCWYSGLAC